MKSPAILNLFLKQLEFSLKRLLEIHGSLWLNLALLRLLHFDHNISDVVKSHVEDLSVLISVEKPTVLVNDGLVIRVRFLTNYTRAMHNIILFYLLKGLLTLNFDCVLHEGREDLGELDFGALLSLITV